MSIVPFGSYIIWGSVLENSSGATMKTTSAYVNDTWRLTDKFTLSAGLRYDQNKGNDAGGQTTTDDSRVSPRLSAINSILQHIRRGKVLSAVRRPSIPRSVACRLLTLAMGAASWLCRKLGR